MKWVLLPLMLFAFNVAAWEDEETVSYDEIVADLKSQATVTTKASAKKPVLNFDDMRAYFGIAYGASQVDSTVANGTVTGTQFTLGMDLKQSTAVEASFRNFPFQEVSKSQSVSLQELEGRLIYKPRMNDQWRARLGAGLVTRSLDFTNDNTSSAMVRWTLGLERVLNDWLRLTPEIGVRTALTANDKDRQNIDAGVGFQLVF